MPKRDKIHQRKLEQLESEFHLLLLACLEECARGRWGLFGQNDAVDPEGRYWGWPEAKRLKELAKEIESIRMQFGEGNEECRRLLQLSSLRGANVPGESRLAAELLAELKAREVRGPPIF